MRIKSTFDKNFTIRLQIEASITGKLLTIAWRISFTRESARESVKDCLCIRPSINILFAVFLPTQDVWPLGLFLSVFFFFFFFW